MRKLKLFNWLAAACLVLTFSLHAEENTAEEGDDTVKIDALILYSPGASKLYDHAPLPRLEHLVEVANEAFLSSELNISLNARSIQEFPFSDEATTSTILATAIHDEKINELRDEIGADVVLIYRPYLNGQGCGSAFVAGEEDREHLAFAHISIDCSASSTPHEVGHLLGLGHSHRQGSAGITEYANGHGVDTVFTTIMAYPSSFDNAPRLLTFSSPDLVCTGLPCGVEIDQPQAAHSVLALQQSAPTVAAYRKEVVDPDDALVTPSSPLEQARITYESFIPIYKAAQSQFALMREELLSAYSDTTKAFISYINARRNLLLLQQSENSTDKEAASAEEAIKVQKQQYQDASIRRNLALDSYVSGFYEVLVPATRTLASLRLTYEEELAKVNPPPEPD